MKVNVQYAETHLPDLLAAASRGEIVEIEGAGYTSRILTFPTPKVTNGKGRRTLGAARGLIAMPSEEEWRATDKELERLMNDGTVFPGEAL